MTACRLKLKWPQRFLGRAMIIKVVFGVVCWFLRAKATESVTHGEIRKTADVCLKAGLWKLAEALRVCDRGANLGNGCLLSSEHGAPKPFRLGACSYRQVYFDSHIQDKVPPSCGSRPMALVLATLTLLLARIALRT